MTNSSSKAWSASVEVKAKFEWGVVKKGSVEASVEYGRGHESVESSELSSELSNATESTCTATCVAVEGKRAYLYQWNKTAYAQGKGQSLTISTCNYVCTYHRN